MRRILKTDTLPLLALRGLVMFPHITLHFDVGRDRSIAALNEAVTTNQKIFLVTQHDLETDEPQLDELFSIGVVAQIRQVLRLPGNGLRVVVEGMYRAKIGKLIASDPFMRVTLIECPEHHLSDKLLESAYINGCRHYFASFAQYSQNLPQDVTMKVQSIPDLSYLVDFIASNLPLVYADKQTVLSTVPVARRSETLIRILQRETEILEIEQQIQGRVNEQMDKNQREYYLREQVKAITEELGEADNPLEEADAYMETIRSLDLSDEVRDAFVKEAEKLKKMPLGSHEATVSRNYLDTVLSLPWNVKTKELADLAEARRILDRDHYGLEKVKERILEALAVRMMSSSKPGNILCLVGPPGVGKTSVASSVAQALGRKYVRVSLGGVRDEAEIRGHRKTYIGAMMGRIMTAVRQSGTSNPLMLLDEVDKLGNDFRGDPSSALLEVLDQAQNNRFVDHFVEVPFDLSDVFFITTANDASSIPLPLFDRMDVIELGSYTAEEKFHIAKEHLLKKQLKANGLNARKLRISDKQIRLLIEGYTREAGVRQLERLLAKICRKTAKILLETDKKSLSVTDLEAFLGPVKYKPADDTHEDTVGLVNGLAWTSVGGELLPIEVAVLPGSGKIELTGSLGDVMKESAKIAISYVRSAADRWNLQEDFYKTKDIHIHAPEGAVPKDGPSAGAAMATAVLSALSGIPIRGDVAMTGELSLRGRILPIGGLREKLMAAYTHQIKTVLIPAANESDLAEIDETVKAGLRIVTVKTMDDVLTKALCHPYPAQKMLQRGAVEAVIDTSANPNLQPGLPLV